MSKNKQISINELKNFALKYRENVLDLFTNR